MVFEFMWGLAFLGHGLNFWKSRPPAASDIYGNAQWASGKELGKALRDRTGDYDPTFRD